MALLIGVGPEVIAEVLKGFEHGVIVAAAAAVGVGLMVVAAATVVVLAVAVAEAVITARQI